MQLFRFFALAVGACAAVVMTAADAQSNARICRQLQHEARELRQAGSGASRANLERELRQAEKEVRRAGCTGLRLIFGKNRNCGALRSNMHRLRRQVQSAGSAPSPQRRLRTVEAEMRRHGCAGGSQQASEGTVQNPRKAAQSNRYRTLCVRECDGYYFPIGFATPKSELDRDEAVCQAFYREGEGELYIHASGSDEEAAAMTSLDGEAYADESFAFAYRSAYRPACAALLRDGIRPDKPDKKGDTTVTMDLSSAVPIPVPRPSLPEDSHTAAGAGGDAIANGIEETDPAEIRVVGPATPYLVGKPADGAVMPLASAPERVQPAEDAFWSNRITGVVAPAAQAGEAGE